MQFSDMQVVEMLEDKSAIIIDQIRQVQQFLSLTAYESRAKTALLINFQDANPQAQNALLKTLEESPGTSRLIITTDTPESLLPTIVSRCEVLNLRPISARKVSITLVSRLGVESHLAELLGHISGGRYGYARYLAEEPDLLEQRTMWLDEWVELQGMNRRQMFKFVENKLSRRKDLKKQRETLRDMLACWMSFTRDILLCASGAVSEPMNMDRKGELIGMAEKIRPDQAAGMIRSLDKAAERIDRFCNPRLVMETLMLELRRDK
jgi:DNA polymerase-3 subunit delta'